MPQEPSPQTDEHKLESRRKRGRLIQRLLLLDVVSDKESRPAFFWAIGTLAIGTFLFHWIEGWNYLDSLYFCVISLATVGYGDFTPDTQLGKVLTMIYIVNGIGILLALFDRIRVVRTRGRNDSER